MANKRIKQKQRLIDNLAKHKIPVRIEYSTDLAEPVYAVCLVENPEYWIDAFPTKDKAIEYCTKLRLNYEHS